MEWWRIYYTDNDVLASSYATPFNITRRADVQVIVQENKDSNWVTLSGYDYYMWDDRGGGFRWFGGDQFGLYHYLLQPGEKCVLFGTHIDNDRFREIFDRARAEMGEKTTFKREERRP